MMLSIALPLPTCNGGKGAPCGNGGKGVSHGNSIEGAYVAMVAWAHVLCVVKGATEGDGE